MQGLSREVQHVGQQQRERFVADDIACAPHGMTEAERRLLAREARLARHLASSRTRASKFGRLAALRQRALELELAGRSGPR